MRKIKRETATDSRLQEELFFLVMDAIAPWVFPENFFDVASRNVENWRIADVTMKDQQVSMCVMDVNSHQKYTALICCLGEPEILAVSYSSGKLDMLNPYLDCGQKLEADLDGLGCWNVLSVAFPAEEGAQAIRFSRQGQVREVEVNQFGCFSIIDWNSNLPVDEYLAVKVDGIWKKTAVAAIPYTIDHISVCWRTAVVENGEWSKHWKHWITTAFIELGGSDRTLLQQQMMGAFSDEENKLCYQAFKKERQKYINREKSLLEQPAFK